MKKILIFAGTTEGRTLAKIFHNNGLEVHICVATEYGEKVLDEELADLVTVGRLDAEQMAELMESMQIDTVIDATHPYAVVVSENIRKACAAAGTAYLRLLRKSEADEIRDMKDCILVNCVEEAVIYLQNHPGKALLTTGSKELHKFTKVEGYRERFVARVLSTAEVAASCKELGFEGSNLILMQGPFSEDMNVAMLKQIGAEYLVTKESGKAGGFVDKVRAARRAGAKLILIRRPSEETGYSMEELVEMFCPEALGDVKNVEFISTEPRLVTLLGIGMGAEGQLTWEGIKACQRADVIIGARRMLDTLRTFGKPEFESYKSDEILRFIHDNSQYHRVVIALSGDVGFYSGAKKLLDGIHEDKVEVLCGISSVVYFCGQLRTSWEDVKLISLHGRYANLVAEVRENRKVFSLIGGSDGVSKACRQLIRYGLGHVHVAVGQNLSYPDQQIWQGTPEEMMSVPAEGLNVILIENPNAGYQMVTHGIPDDFFLRDKVPMTKEEVRDVSLSKMQLKRDSVIYDVGAGTGSVSVEAARICTAGQVYAIEKKPEAVALIERNCQKFGTSNVMVINGLAPEALQDLPVPTHAFIGGSSGNMHQIIDAIRMKNPNTRFVVNAIALETVGEIVEYLNAHPPVHEDVIQLQVSRSRILGAYHMMTGLNPVLIAAFDYCNTDQICD